MTTTDVPPKPRQVQCLHGQVNSWSRAPISRSRMPFAARETFRRPAESQTLV